jgi:hypothetical protein
LDHPKNFRIEEKSPVKLHHLLWGGDFSGNFSDHQNQKDLILKIGSGTFYKFFLIRNRVINPQFG